MLSICKPTFAANTAASAPATTPVCSTVWLVLKFKLHPPHPFACRSCAYLAF